MVVLPGSRRWPQSWRLPCWEISLCREDVSAAAPPPGTARGPLQTAAGTAASCTQFQSSRENGVGSVSEKSQRLSKLVTDVLQRTEASGSSAESKFSVWGADEEQQILTRWSSAEILWTPMGGNDIINELRASTWITSKVETNAQISLSVYLHVTRSILSFLQFLFFVVSFFQSKIIFLNVQLNLLNLSFVFIFKWKLFSLYHHLITSLIEAGDVHRDHFVLKIHMTHKTPLFMWAHWEPETQQADNHCGHTNYLWLGFEFVWSC